MADRLAMLKESAEKAAGMNYESTEAKAALGMWPGDEADWEQFYPEVDPWGELTGRVIDYDDPGFIVIDDIVMIEKASLDNAELRRLRDGHFPVRDTKPTPASNPSPKLGRKWKKGQNIQHGDDLYNQPVGIGKNTFVVLPETIEGTASVAAVDESGWIVSWFMRHESVEEAIAYVKEHGKPKGWEPGDE